MITFENLLDGKLAELKADALRLNQLLQLEIWRDAEKQEIQEFKNKFPMKSLQEIISHCAYVFAEEEIVNSTLNLYAKLYTVIGLLRIYNPSEWPNVLVDSIIFAQARFPCLDFFINPSLRTKPAAILKINSNSPQAQYLNLNVAKLTANSAFANFFITTLIHRIIIETQMQSFFEFGINLAPMDKKPQQRSINFIFGFLIDEEQVPYAIRMLNQEDLETILFFNKNKQLLMALCSTELWKKVLRPILVELITEQRFSANELAEFPTELKEIIEAQVAFKEKQTPILADYHKVIAVTGFYPGLLDLFRVESALVFAVLEQAQFFLASKRACEKAFEVFYLAKQLPFDNSCNKTIALFKLLLPLEQYLSDRWCAEIERIQNEDPSKTAIDTLMPFWQAVPDWCKQYFTGCFLERVLHKLPTVSAEISFRLKKNDISLLLKRRDAYKELARMNVKIFEHSTPYDAQAVEKLLTLLETTGLDPETINLLERKFAEFPVLWAFVLNYLRQTEKQFSIETQKSLAEKHDEIARNLNGVKFECHFFVEAKRYLQLHQHKISGAEILQLYHIFGASILQEMALYPDFIVRLNAEKNVQKLREKFSSAIFTNQAVEGQEESPMQLNSIENILDEISALVSNSVTRPESLKNCAVLTTIKANLTKISTFQKIEDLHLINMLINTFPVDERDLLLWLFSGALASLSLFESILVKLFASLRINYAQLLNEPQYLTDEIINYVFKKIQAGEFFVEPTLCDVTQWNDFTLKLFQAAATGSSEAKPSNSPDYLRPVVRRWSIWNALEAPLAESSFSCVKAPYAYDHIPKLCSLIAKLGIDEIMLCVLKEKLFAMSFIFYKILLSHLSGLTSLTKDQKELVLHALAATPTDDYSQFYYLPDALNYLDTKQASLVQIKLLKCLYPNDFSIKYIFSGVAGLFYDETLWPNDLVDLGVWVEEKAITFDAVLREIEGIVDAADVSALQNDQLCKELTKKLLSVPLEQKIFHQLINLVTLLSQADNLFTALFFTSQGGGFVAAQAEKLFVSQNLDWAQLFSKQKKPLRRSAQLIQLIQLMRTQPLDFLQSDKNRIPFILALSQISEDFLMVANNGLGISSSLEQFESFKIIYQDVTSKSISALQERSLNDLKDCLWVFSGQQKNKSAFFNSLLLLKKIPGDGHDLIFWLLNSASLGFKFARTAVADLLAPSLQRESPLTFSHFFDEKYSSDKIIGVIHDVVFKKPIFSEKDLPSFSVLYGLSWTEASFNFLCRFLAYFIKKKPNQLMVLSAMLMAVKEHKQSLFSRFSVVAYLFQETQCSLNQLLICSQQKYNALGSWKITGVDELLTLADLKSLDDDTLKMLLSQPSALVKLFREIGKVHHLYLVRRLGWDFVISKAIALNDWDKLLSVLSFDIAAVVMCRHLNWHVEGIISIFQEQRLSGFRSLKIIDSSFPQSQDNILIFLIYLRSQLRLGYEELLCELYNAGKKDLLLKFLGYLVQTDDDELSDDIANIRIRAWFPAAQNPLPRIDTLLIRQIDEFFERLKRQQLRSQFFSNLQKSFSDVLDGQLRFNQRFSQHQLTIPPVDKTTKINLNSKLDDAIKAVTQALKIIDEPVLSDEKSVDEAIKFAHQTVQTFVAAAQDTGYRKIAQWALKVGFVLTCVLIGAMMGAVLSAAFTGGLDGGSVGGAIGSIAAASIALKLAGVGALSFGAFFGAFIAFFSFKKGLFDPARGERLYYSESSMQKQSMGQTDRSCGFSWRHFAFTRLGLFAPKHVAAARIGHTLKSEIPPLPKRVL